MAEQRANNNKQNPETESIISRCGSISGETIVSLRSRSNCTPGRTPHKLDRLARNLKDYHNQSPASLQPDNSSCCDDVSKIGGRQYINNCFHNYRFVIAMLGGLSVGTMLFLRYSMTIAILRMVNQTHLYLEEHPNKTMQDFLDEGFTTGGEFNWNNEMIAIILGWYMFSYTLPQTLAAKWTVAMGCRYAVPLSLVVCAISNMLIPTAAYMGWQWVVACRLVNGVGAAGLLPGMLKLLEDWMRYDELSSGLCTAQFLVACMTAVCPLISGYLTAIHWSQAFYAPSLATFVFCIIFIVLVSNKPQSNWLISRRELEHICECDMVEPTVPTNSITEKQPKDTENGHCGGGVKDKQVLDDSDYDYKPDSWVQILRLRQFYAYLVIWMINCSSYTGFTFILPAYMRQFLKIPISENGFYCFIIQLGFLIAVSWPHQMLRLLLRYNLTITRARILSQGLCTFMMATTWLYVGTYHQYQLPLLFLNRCFVSTDVIVTGSVMSNFAKAGLSSLAFAMINTIGNLSITGASTIIGWWLDYTGSSAQGWQIIFYGLSIAQIAMFLTFALFIDSEPIKFKNKSKQQTGMRPDEPVFSIEDYRRDSLVASKQASQQPQDRDEKREDNFKKLVEKSKAPNGK